ncbi:unnamed protein product [Lymnaea stagnalis]|uniref:Uncharacterized protein n=1 Tax=Lymnaea stagnalis TaxID=6523 RepID=A0AAV2HSC8_LYMST
MGLPGGQTILYFVALITVAIGEVLLIIGLATPEWTAADSKLLDVHLSKGLWQLCASGTCRSIGPNKAASLEVCQAFTLLAMVEGLFCIGLFVLHVVLPIMGKQSHRLLPRVAMATSVIALACDVVSLSVWGAKHYTADGINYLGYSFILTLVGSIVVAIGGVVGWLCARRSPSSSVA